LASTRLRGTRLAIEPHDLLIPGVNELGQPGNDPCSRALCHDGADHIIAALIVGTRPTRNPREMIMAGSESATDWLLRAGAGDPNALEKVFPLVYEELRRLAHRYLEREATGHTLMTTDLVHEAYIRLVDQTRVQWTGRAHFMAIAATAMRRILVDHARQHRAGKRGGGRPPVALEAADAAASAPAELILELDHALARLGALEPRRARIVECRFFGGMTEPEIAEALQIGLRTVKRDWARARTWLYGEIYAETAS
jgi:RNA polymerase sigma factor (TIGR02999 family)